MENAKSVSRLRFESSIMKDLEKAHFDLDKSIDVGYLRGRTAVEGNDNSLDSARMKVGLLAEKASFEDGSFDDPHYLDKYMGQTAKHLGDADSSIASLDLSKLKEEIISGTREGIVLASPLIHSITSYSLYIYFSYRKAST